MQHLIHEAAKVAFDVLGGKAVSKVAQPSEEYKTLLIGIDLPYKNCRHHA